MGLGIGIGISPVLSNTIGSGNPPINTVTPVISGDIGLGGELITTNGTWVGDPVIAYSYQWNRNGIAILGATNSTYTITISDSNKNITCTVTATNDTGSANATSNTISIPVFLAPSNTIAPAITGTAQEGQTVTCSTGTWTGTAPITYAYQWKRNGSNIGSATNSTYTLVTADVSQSITCEVTASNAVGSANATSNTITPIAAIDPDAQAFITAANITNPTQQGAINTLVVNLKGYSIWTKMKAIYPIVGGSASSHAVNLKTPGTFNLSFTTGWTHSANGMTPNIAYADTNFSISSQMTASNAAFGIYSRTNDTTGLKVIGAFDVASFSRMWINLTNGNIQIVDTGQIPYTANPSTGFFMSRRDATNFNQSYKNGVSLGSVTNNFSVFNRNFYLGATNDNGTPNYYSNHQMAFAFLGGNTALTNTDASNLYTAVQAYQTTLGRQV